MAGCAEKLAVRRALKKAHAAQRLKEIDPPLPPLKEDGGFNIFLFFNIEPLGGIGHLFMGCAPVGGPISTLSYYPTSGKASAPAKVASLHHPVSFQDIQDASGWITHGNDGKFWNEHITCCLAIECDKRSYKQFKAYSDKVKAKPGKYRILTHNCVHIAVKALAQGGISLETKSGKKLRSIVPLTIFEDVAKVKGATKFGKWAYWFPPAPVPDNGFKTHELIVSKAI